MVSILTIVTGLGLGLCASQAAAATFTETGDQLVLQTTGWTLALDAPHGAIRRIEDRTASGTLLRGGPDLWTIQRHNQPQINSGACRLRHAWNASARELTLQFDAPEAAVRLVCQAADEGPAWRAEVRMKQGTMLGWRFPAELEFDVPGLQQFVFPENLGLSFARPFFESNAAGIRRHSIGPAGLQQIAGDRCQMRPLRDAPVPLRPGNDAAGWLPDWYLKEMARWQVIANRCPAGAKHDLSLVETEHGTWLSGYRLGGWGWLFRFGGMLREPDSRAQMASVIATLSRLYRTAPQSGSEVPVPDGLAGKAPGRWAEPPRRIGLLQPRPTARPGTRQRPNPTRWQTQLGQEKWLTAAGIEIVPLRDAAALRAAVCEPRRWFAIVNTQAEGFPAESADEAKSMLAAIRDYVRHGGIWWDAAGGYSFYAALLSGGDAAFRTASRDFCDFAALQSTAGRWALFGVQKPEDIFVPSGAELGSSGSAGSRVGRYAHSFTAFATPGQSVQLPQLQMVLGKPHREALRDYGRRNGFARTLTDKARPELVEALKRTILLKVEPRKLSETTQIAAGLRFPALVHISNYLRGGFDKQYPDHLPPHPDAGTADELAQLIRTCRDKGHLFMPYTNPTWWCTNPKGPTFEQQGDAPLSRDFEGQVYPESYGSNVTQGYTICAWHPAVRAANDLIRTQFTQQYPVDVLFQDQVGARGHRWDTNPAAPHAGAYLEGIHRIAQVDAKTIPLGTEDGHDRLINHEIMFCGLSAPWLPNRPHNAHVLYEDVWPDDAWRIEPLALFLAHDKVLFYHHDLGGFVRNRLDLSMSLALGYSLSWRTRSTAPPQAEVDWLERLCRVQAAIGPQCAGQALTDFDYLAPRVIRSRWGHLEIVANLSPDPWPLDTATTIAPEGFSARSPDLEAGIFARRAGRDCPGGLWLIRQKGPTGWQEWTAGGENP